MRHGQARIGKVAKEYLAWKRMRQRCYNPRFINFHRYGGRGIGVNSAWNSSFAAFLADMGPAPSPKHSLDRIDNEKDYGPGNCRWATVAEQNRNKGNNKNFEIDGKAKTLPEWAEIYGVSPVAARYRLSVGWTAKDAITIPTPAMRRRAKAKGLK